MTGRAAKTTFAIGRQVEQAAADHLQHSGYQIIEQNWRTRWCEIDIVACLGQVVYFVEVKYRSKPSSGSGLDYITPAKLHQMSRAAESWVQQNDWLFEYQLLVIELAGEVPTVSQVLDL